jgi:hypothetical protein
MFHVARLHLDASASCGGDARTTLPLLLPVQVLYRSGWEAELGSQNPGSPEARRGGHCGIRAALVLTMILRLSRGAW